MDASTMAARSRCRAGAVESQPALTSLVRQAQPSALPYGLMLNASRLRRWRRRRPPSWRHDRFHLTTQSVRRRSCVRSQMEDFCRRNGPILRVLVHHHHRAMATIPSRSAPRQCWRCGSRHLTFPPPRCRIFTGEGIFLRVVRPAWRASSHLRTRLRINGRPIMVRSDLGGDLGSRWGPNTIASSLMASAVLLILPRRKWLHRSSGHGDPTARVTPERSRPRQDDRA